MKEKLMYLYLHRLSEASQRKPDHGKARYQTDALLLTALKDYRERIGISGTDRKGTGAGQADLRENHQKSDQINQGSDVSVMRTALGRPYFIRSDGVFCSTQCSVSHSGRFWICALSEARLGIDMEDPDHSRIHNEERIARRFFSPIEMEFVQEGGRETFYRLWVRKEALLKYRGTGLTGLEDCPVVEPSSLWFWDVTLQPGVFAAVCGAVPLKWKEIVEL